MAYARALPTANPDGTAVALPSRTGTYGEAFTLPLGGGANYLFADEGSFMVAQNATVGTGIAGHAAPVIGDDATKALLHVFNAATSTKNIIPVYLRLEFTAIGSGGTISYNVVNVDKAGTTARSSGGTAITPYNTKSSATDSTNATIYFGPVVVAPTSQRRVFAAQCREVIPVVTDTMTIFFGAPIGAVTSALTTAGTATNHIVQYAPPISIAPGGNFYFTRLRASQSGADSYTFSFGYIER